MPGLAERALLRMTKIEILLLNPCLILRDIATKQSKRMVRQHEG